jgi:hypothetical protein
MPKPSRNSHPPFLCANSEAGRSHRGLIVFLSSTLLALSVIISGCTGVTSAKGTSASAATNTTTTNSAPSAALSASPAAVSFGNVPMGSTSNQSLTITNSGTSAVTISQVAASGAGFALAGVALPVNLDPGNGATFTASFAPSTTGNASGAASFSSSQLSSPLIVQMSGTGTAVAPSITAQPVSSSVVAGQTASFSISASGTAPLNYQWRKNSIVIAGATSASYTTPPETTSDNGAQFSVVVNNSAGNATSNAATLSVTTSPVAPSITTQPGNQTIFAGQTATFSVIANGTSPLSYQWRKNGTAISGAISASYTTPAETTSDNGALFSVVVSNSVGNVTSNSATLTVNPDPVAPSITSQPASQTITAGQTATFSVTASGTAPLSYQWQKNGAAISGATSSSYTTPSETTADNSAQFSVVVSNSAGTAASNNAVLTVNAAPVAPSITTQPANKTITAGQTATFSVTASGTAPLSYQWSKNGITVSGATSASYTTPAETTSDNGAQFSVVVSNSVGTATSNNAVLTVNAVVAPSVTTQPSSQTITAGQTATFSVTASGTAPLSYQWSKNGTTVSGATSASYTTPAETTSDNGAQFSVVVSNSAGNVTSNAATLTVNAPPPGAFTPNKTSLGFGNVIVSNNSAMGVNFTNSGSVNITVSGVTVSGAGFTASGISNGQIITPGQVVTLSVTFAPAATGSVTGNVTVTSNASNSPTSISLSGSGVLAHTATLNWIASTSTVIGYNIYRGTASGGPYSLVNSSPIATTQYVDSGVLAGQTYYYVATAVASGNVESTYSNQVTAVVPAP